MWSKTCGLISWVRVKVDKSADLGVDRSVDSGVDRGIGFEEDSGFRQRSWILSWE